MGDMFGDGGLDFSMSARGNGRGHGNGYGNGYNNYNGYGNGYNNYNGYNGYNGYGPGYGYGGRPAYGYGGPQYGAQPAAAPTTAGQAVFVPGYGWMVQAPAPAAAPAK